MKLKHMIFTSVLIFTCYFTYYKYSNNISTLTRLPATKQSPNPNNLIPLPSTRSLSGNKSNYIDTDTITKMVTHVPRIHRVNRNMIDSLTNEKIPLNAHWTLLGKASAVPESAYQENLGTLIIKSNGYAFFKSNQINPNTFNQNFGYYVVYNEKRKKLGIISGTYIVTYDHEQTIYSISEKFKLPLAKIFPTLNVAFFHAVQGQNIFEMNNKIKKVSGVRTSTLEILENSARVK